MNPDIVAEGVESGTGGLEQEALDQAFRDFIGSVLALICAIESSGSAVKHMKLALLHALLQVATYGQEPYQIDEILEAFGEPTP